MSQPAPLLRLYTILIHYKDAHTYLRVLRNSLYLSPSLSISLFLSLFLQIEDIALVYNRADDNEQKYLDLDGDMEELTADYGLICDKSAHTHTHTVHKVPGCKHNIMFCSNSWSLLLIMFVLCHVHYNNLHHNTIPYCTPLSHHTSSHHSHTQHLTTLTLNTSPLSHLTTLTLNTHTLDYLIISHALSLEGLYVVIYTSLTAHYISSQYDHVCICI